jgi:hypothetical protein
VAAGALPLGLVGCAHAGEDKARAAHTATPVIRCFMALILRSVSVNGALISTVPPDIEPAQLLGDPSQPHVVQRRSKALGRRG